jgi:hypothetical protein
LSVIDFVIVLYYNSLRRALVRFIAFSSDKEQREVTMSSVDMFDDDGRLRIVFNLVALQSKP